MSLGVFHHGRIVYTAHFGQKEVTQPDPPDDDSVYMVASTFKIVTVCAVARLVTDGLIEWDTPILTYRPSFRRKDELASCTIRDLISNRTGLPMASFYWGQQNGEQLLDKSEYTRLASTIEAVRPFRSTFLYSQWNFNLLQLIVEKAAGKSFGAFVKEAIFDPLGMGSTFAFPRGENIAKPHAVRNDGTASNIVTNSFASDTGLAAGGGGKSSLKDQLLIYLSLLNAYQYQTENMTDATPGSPFTQLRTIFTPHIRLPGSNMESQANCLGIHRTGNLSCASLNATLPRKMVPEFGKNTECEEVSHHSGTQVGFLHAAYMVPRKQSGVVVLTSATPLVDAADFSAQLLLSVLLDLPPPESEPLLRLSSLAVKTQLSWWDQIKAFLTSCKTDTPPTHQLEFYTGNYWNTLRNFKLVVRANGHGLHLLVQGMAITKYDLSHCDENTFVWAADREDELVRRGMWLQPLPQFHMINFGVNQTSVQSLFWQHDRQMKPERFGKECNDTAKL
ncbi:beta-lactamase/transpeptidase-like protein [Amniculicola lignicola CBS 123094]|uniref:Beta-lactamase/transpeptidase-like protein n=1 Tax=Amniculicola lignicola CBS 123094 TaxID=1392246 RepID=A0A6A5X1G0_9PLEO|nr:beta-lactamase/transpeptidase-like protein [Amniculicola lignicola CBS 123094]